MDEETEHYPVSCCSSNIGSFICGACGVTLDSICSLHVHMTDQHSDGSYHYDNLIKTAFPKYDTFCAGTQTSRMDKKYLRRYRESRTGKPPRRVNKIKVECEVRGNSVLLKTESHVDQDNVQVTKQESGFKAISQKQNNMSSRYKFRTSTKLKRMLLQSCTVPLDRLEQDSRVKKGKKKYRHTNVVDNRSKTTNESTFTQVKQEFNDDDNDSGTTSTGGIFNIGDGMYVDDEDNWENAHDLNEEILPTDETSDSPSPVVLLPDNELPVSLTEVSTNQSTAVLYSSDNGINKDHVHVGDNVPKGKYIRRKKAVKHDLDLDVSVLVDTNRKRKLSFNNLCGMENEPKEHVNKHSKRTVKTTCKANHSKKTNVKPTESKLDGKPTEKKLYHYTYVCHLCGKELPKTGKEAHINNHTGLRPYICEECGNSFASNRQLKSHLRIHAREKGIHEFKFVCTECGKIFFTKDALNCHVNNHTGSKPYKCPQCNAAFAMEKYLIDHMRRVHEKVKKVKCAGCGKMYFNKSAMMKHFSVHHAEPSLPCKYCGRLFQLHEVRHNHELTHTGEKEFYCCVCQHGFIQWWPYLGHMMKQHGFSKQQVVEMKKQLKQTDKKVAAPVVEDALGTMETPRILTSTCSTTELCVVHGSGDVS